MEYCLVQVSNSILIIVMIIRAAIVGTPLQPVINDSDTDKDVIVQDFSASCSMDSNKLTLNSISFSVNKVRSYTAWLP